MQYMAHTVRLLIPDRWNKRRSYPGTLRSYVLNYKGLNYCTEWVEFPDIEAVCKKLGANPTTTKADGITPLYTLPILFDPSTQSVIAESAVIAAYLDKTYPDTPPVFPPGTHGLYEAFREAVDGVFSYKIYPLVVYETLRLLNPSSEEYYNRTREADFGMPLAKLAPPGTEETEKQWKVAEAGLLKVAGWYDIGAGVGKTSVFISGGGKPNVADMFIAGRLIWVRAILGETSEKWLEIMSWDGGRWKRFMEAFKEYEQVF